MCAGNSNTFICGESRGRGSLQTYIYVYIFICVCTRMYGYSEFYVFLLFGLDCVLLINGHTLKENSRETKNVY